MAVATKTAFDSSHPIRRFLTPFIYGTLTVNDNARSLLVSPGGFAPRCFALTPEGIEQELGSPRS